MLRQRKVTRKEGRGGKYSAVQFLDEQDQMERLPAEPAEKKNNMELVCVPSLIRTRQCSV